MSTLKWAFAGTVLAAFALAALSQVAPALSPGAIASKLPKVA